MVLRRTLFYTFFLFLLLVSFAEQFGHGKHHDYFEKEKGTTRYTLNSGECNSESLTCVPEDDCELECPYGFYKLESGGACYYVSSEEYNPQRTLHEAEDFCQVLNSRLLWLEDSKELRELVDLYQDLNGITNMTTTTTEATTNTTEISNSTLDFSIIAKISSFETRQTILKHENFFLAANYDKSKGSWIWKGTHDTIDWDILLHGTLNAEQSLKVVENANINKCLTLNLAVTVESEEPLIQESDCIADNGFICKMGEAGARCSKTSSTKCCFSPSYDFYIKNREHGFANFNFKPGGCEMKIGEELKKCDEVLPQIKQEQNEETNKYSLARIGSSYYYIANSTEDCLGREAVIQNEEVHSFVTSLFATRENYYASKNIKIGLTFKLENKMAYWVNGKPNDFYEEFWFPGEPKRDDSVDGGCAAYSNVEETATYLWKLFSKEMCEGFDKICELPLQKSSSSVSKTKDDRCGVRYERGVLAKAVHSIYSSDEANFGEFPWQAAILYPEKYGREVKRKFACSGALIHKSFVLTSAHCVTSVNTKRFMVILGQHDLYDDSYILEPLVIDVKEVILHQDFNVRKSSLHDLALLQLDGEVDTEAYPHIGLGCLPDPDEIRSHGGNWECFITGWSKNKYGYHSKILKRLEAEFTSEEYCRYINKDYYDILYKSKQYNNYDHPHYRSEDSELLCTNSAYNECLEDQSPLLVCKRSSEYVRKPFYDDHGYDHKSLGDYEKSKYTDYTQRNRVQNTRKRRIPYTYSHDDEVIINAYGESRFNSEKWYIIGVGNTMSQCRDLLDKHEYDRYGNDYDRYGRFNKPYKGSSFFKSVNKNAHDYSNKRPLFEENKKSDLHKLKPNGKETFKVKYDYSKKLPHRGFNYKNKYGITEVFTSVYDYINFIYYILDLHQ